MHLVGRSNRFSN